MNDSLVTLAGWLGQDVELREAGGVPVASLRIACTPRRFDRKTEQWVNADTQWYAVTAWRHLAENCAASLRRGDPVVLHGRMSAERWTNSAGVEMTTMKVEANFVAHDLNRGVSRFARTPKQAPTAEESVPEVTTVAIEEIPAESAA